MRYKLGDLTKIYTGKLNANAATPDGKYPFFTCSKEVSRINTYSYDCECILVAGNGDLNVKYFHGKFNAYQRTYIIENKRNEIIYMPYLYYFMSYYIDKLRNQTIGGVIKYIKLSNLTDIVIELPTMDVQRKIVEKLKKLRRIRLNKEDELIKLDSLVKARFVEMFGDPVKNEKKFLTKQLSQIGKCKNGINFHKSEIGNTVNCLTVKDFENNQVINDTTRLAKIKLSNLPSNDYFLNNGDIVFVRSNGNKSLVGRSVLIFPNNNPTLFSGFCIRFRKDSKRLESVYLLWLLKNESIRMKMRGRGVNIQNLNQQIINNLSIPVPPIELQKEFASFVQQVDKSKVAIQKSLDETQTLFDSLMQKYFS